MRTTALLAAVALMVAGGCGDDDDRNNTAAGGESGGGTGGELSLTVASEPDPPAAGKPVTWVLTVRNGGTEEVTLTFASGRRGDVVLEREGDEAYRWSTDKFFTEAVGKERLRPDQESVYRLEDRTLPVGPGTYEVVATLAAEPEVGPVRQRVDVE